MTPAEIAIQLPPPRLLERLSLSLAALDAVMSPEWEYRYYSFDPRWSPTQRMASMRNGSGDQNFIVFDPVGTVVRAFDHESALSAWSQPENRLAPGLLDGYPEGLQEIIDEPAFRTEGGPPTDLTFCAWCLSDDRTWSVGTIDDDGGASKLLGLFLDGRPSAYRSFAVDYFESDPGDGVDDFYGLQPADTTAVQRLNPEADPAAVLTELESMGYPVSRG